MKLSHLMFLLVVALSLMLLLVLALSSLGLADDSQKRDGTAPTAGSLRALDVV